MEKAKLKTRTHKNVMSRVSNPSGSHFKPKYVVTRHATASSGAKPISSTVSNTSGFCDLPIALNDYIPETMSETVKRRTFVVKPKKTVKSLPPTVPPTVLKTRNARVHTNLYSRSSAPTVLNVLNSGRTLNSSTGNSQRLKEIKDEIKAYHEKERNIKLSDSLHKKFGLQLHNDGYVADKGTQDVEQKDSHRGTPRSSDHSMDFVNTRRRGAQTDTFCSSVKSDESSTAAGTLAAATCISRLASKCKCKHKARNTKACPASREPRRETGRKLKFTLSASSASRDSQRTHPLAAAARSLPATESKPSPTQQKLRKC